MTDKKHETATTGRDNPLREWTADEQSRITAAEQASQEAYSAFKQAKDEGKSKEEVDALREKAMEKEEVLKGLQDLCD